MTDAWVAETRCLYCGEPIGQRPWMNEGSGHGELFVHVRCDPAVMRAYTRQLREALAAAEAVCWAKFRIEAVGETSVNPEEDRQRYADAWVRWKARTDG